jgi:transcription-repair coupling factor (superfamily II helicase)
VNLETVLNEYGRIRPLQILAEQLPHESALYLEGVSGAGPALILASLLNRQRNPVLVILEQKEEALYFKNDLEHLLPGETVLFLPESAMRPFKPAQVHAGSVQERAETISLLRKKRSRILVTYASAAAELVIEEQELKKNTIELSVGQDLDLDFLLEYLQEHGFTREDFVFEPGQFSLRGGIMDLFSFAHEHPYRIELDGNQVESIRTFDISSQLSIKEIGFFTLIPDIRSDEIARNRVELADYLDPDTLLWMRNPVLQEASLKKLWATALQEHLNSDAAEKPEPPSVHYMPPGSLSRWRQRFKTIDFGSERPEHNNIIRFQQSPQPQFQRNFDMLINWMKQNQDAGIHNLVFSDNPRQIERLHTIFNDLNAGINFHPIYHGLSQGFIDADAQAAFTTEHQLFDKYYRPRSRQRYSSSTAMTLRELRNLNPGDYVTHIDHGIGKFAGLQRMEMNGVMQEVVRLVYKDGDELYVSVNSLHKISKHSGKEGTAPTLHKLGSATWERQKKNTKKKVKDIARELISLYARRKSEPGFSFTPDSYLQVELEASFFYEDTPDQAKSTEDVKRDMQAEHPMDRLVCGDVGFGKTEVAMRAAFKAATDGKQVAVLVPTTILAHQHYRTFVKRFSGFPVSVSYLNRFKSPREQKETLQKLKDGKIDIIIGTHRLLAKDVQFKDLGLLIIDEEQKFGVSSKEKLKELRVNVDTLTLTATPIPRTLHFSLMGARDLSIINTPPPNRQPVHTELHVFNKELIGRAISEELNRGGQAFFIHSRVKDIHEVARMVEEACPGARVAVAHGQMGGEELEQVMVRFIEGDFDVLVATTIIESGLDISNANTIIINNAHMFGLSDLHQMRGRVGRSNTRAFCYLLAPPLSTLTDEARKRLRTIEEFNELGSGFQVAMRDLDIRGAGNLLGAEQSGFIADMGFDMYHKILDEAVRELKQEEFGDVFGDIPEDTSTRECVVETDYEMLIPPWFVSSISERLALYNELSAVDSENGLRTFGDNLRDRFGKLPDEVISLMDTVRLKWAGKELGLEKVTLGRGGMKLFFPSDPTHPLFSSERFQKMLQFVAGKPEKFSVRQTDKMLFLQVRLVEDLHQALYVLEEMEQAASASMH